MSGDLEGKVAIVTGGASGIGRASVELFVAEGAKVVIADLNEEGGEALAKSLGTDVAFHRTDVTKEADVEALVAFALGRFGGLDVMFNNAGIAQNTLNAPFVEEDFFDFEKVMAVDLLGPMLGIKHAARHMIKMGKGSIISTCSIGGFFPGIGIPFYRAAKAGLLQVSQSLALELSPQGVRINCISPGPVATPALLEKLGLSGEKAKQVEKIIVDSLMEMQALKQSIQASDIAQGALYLASDRSRRVTGHNLVVAAGSGLGDPIDRTQQIGAAIAKAMQ